MTCPPSRIGFTQHLWGRGQTFRCPWPYSGMLTPCRVRVAGDRRNDRGSFDRRSPDVHRIGDLCTVDCRAMDGCGRRARLSASSCAAGWSRKHVGAIAIAVTLVAIVTPALVVLLARDDRSIGDIALIELRTRDVSVSPSAAVGRVLALRLVSSWAVDVLRLRDPVPAVRWRCRRAADVGAAGQRPRPWCARLARSAPRPCRERSPSSAPRRRWCGVCFPTR